MILITNPIDIHVGKKVREIRKAAGMSQDKLGELVGVTLQQIQKYEIAKTRISAGRLYEFAQIFDKPVSAFFEGCVADRYYHNMDFKSEDECKKLEERKDQEAVILVKFFNRIKSFDTREAMINLIKSMADK